MHVPAYQLTRSSSRIARTSRNRTWTFHPQMKHTTNKDKIRSKKLLFIIHRMALFAPDSLRDLATLSKNDALFSVAIF